MHPERVCWGCDRYCPADNLSCGRDTVRTPHPVELFGDDWMEWCEENGGGNTAERLWGTNDSATETHEDAAAAEERAGVDALSAR
jgi:hypothetical protein